MSPQRPRITETFRLGDCLIRPKDNLIVRGDVNMHVEPRAMETLEFLAYMTGHVVTSERILAECWSTSTLGDNPVHKVITQLRKALGDDPRTPVYIQTIRKRGYRLVAPVVLPEGFEGPVAVAEVGWPHRSPFRGLAAYDADHASVFFGRRQAIASVTTALSAQVAAGHAFVLMVGASGGGKTSLLRAGVLPFLDSHAGVDRYAPVYLDAAIDANIATLLASALTAPRAPALFDGIERPSVSELLAVDPDKAVESIGRRLQGRRVSPADPPPRLLIAVDHFEHVLNDPDGRRRLHAAMLIEKLARSKQCAVIVTCRSDHYPHLVSMPGLLELKRPSGHVDLAMPTPSELSEIIRRPAQMAGLAYEELPGQGRLDDVLRDAAHEHPECLPLLQHTLQHLFERRVGGGVLTFAAYEEFGGLAGTLIQQAERTVGELAPESAATLANLFARLVEMNEADGTVSSRHVSWSELTSTHERDLVSALVHNRLLVSHSDGDRARFALTHEALLRVWPRARSWITTNAKDLRLRGRIVDATRRWSASGQLTELLHPHGRLLDEAAELLNRRPQLLDLESHRWLDASLRLARGRRWAKRLALLTGLVMAAVAMVMGVMAEGSRRVAVQERERSEEMVEFMVDHLGERLEALGRLDLMDDVAVHILDDLQNQEQSSRLPAGSHHAKVLRRLASISLARGDTKQARTLIDRSIAISENWLAGHPSDPERLLELGEAVYWDGYLHYFAGDVPKAVHAWRRYRDLASRSVEMAMDNPAAWLELSYATNSLGTAARTQGDNSAALHLFRESVAQKRNALRYDPDNSKWMADLADSLSWVGSALDRLGRLEQARQTYAEAIDLIRSVRTRSVADTKWIHREAMLLSSHGDLHLALNDSQRAREQYHRSIGLLDHLTMEQPGHLAWRRDLAALLLRAGRVELSMGDQAAAGRLLDQAAQLLDVMEQQRADVYGLVQLACELDLGLARLHHADGRIDAARLRIDAATERFRRLSAARALNLSEVLVRVDIAMLEAELTLTETPATDEAKRHWQTAVELLLPHIDGSQDRRSLDAFIRASRLLGNHDEANRAQSVLRLLAVEG